MAKVSVLIPARNERFLVPTVNDVLSKAAGDVEVVAVLEDFGKMDKGEFILPTATDWAKVQAQHGSRLTTIYHHEAKGLRPSVNEAAASAMSRGAKYLMKLDAHCSLSEGWDEVLKADCDRDWVVVPRRGRLDPENWCATDTHKPDIDYHYLSFPDDPNDFGGPGLNGKVWEQRARERAGKPEYDIDDEMSSQGSCWFMHADYFTHLELMDADSFGEFWCEAQEVLMKCWLSGGRCVVNKGVTYLHLHKGRKYGRGYRMPELWLTKGASFAKNWIWNDANFNHKQTRPFEWLIDHFWPIPTWKDDWREVLYANRKPRVLGSAVSGREELPSDRPEVYGLVITSARYGVLGSPQSFSEHSIDVADRVRALVKDGSLDIVVNNSTLAPNQNPFRGKKKVLLLTYAYDGGEPVTVQRVEKDWLIIGQAQARDAAPTVELELDLLQDATKEQLEMTIYGSGISSPQPLSPPALNDYLIRKFQIPAQRLRGPMPIEVPSFHRNDLAVLFAELGFQRGAEIGVAEGNYSEVLLKANPECHLLLVDPWHAYSDNPQNKSKDKHEFAYNETKRKTAGYPNVKLDMRYSMDAVRDVADGSLDFVYLDAHHSYPFIMEDLIAWSRKVRSGGIVSGDDVYKLNEKWGAGPMEAIYHYTEAMRINPWWLISAHKSVDAFFVKP